VVREVPFLVSSTAWKSCFSEPRSAHRSSLPDTVKTSEPLPFATVRNELAEAVVALLEDLGGLKLNKLWPGDGGTSHSGVRLMTRGISENLWCLPRFVDSG
jgi:hypothetical protein